MKKLLSLLFCLTMLLTLSACASGKTETANAKKEVAAPAVKPNAAAKKILVAYFSASGKTKAVASRLAEAAKADLLEIVPSRPYTSDDLNYHNENCRANKEQHDPNSRPAIAASLDNVGKYETVIIGYPIWWGIEPRIIDTFVERCKLDGKTVAVFATSGGSGISSSEKNIKAMCPKADWKGAKLFSAAATAKDAQEWLTAIGIK